VPTFIPSRTSVRIGAELEAAKFQLSFRFVHESGRPLVKPRGISFVITHFLAGGNFASTSADFLLNASKPVLVLLMPQV